MTLSLPLRFGLVLGLVLMLLCGALGVLSYQALNRTFVDQERSRAAVILLDIANSIEDRLNLGLSLPRMQEIQELLEKERAKDPRILSLEVFDDSGRSVFNTDRILIDDPVPEQWLGLSQQAAEQEGRGSWSAVDFEALVLGAPITNSFDRHAGSVVLRFARSAMDQRSETLMGQVLQAVALVGLLAALFALLGTSLLLRPVSRALRAASRLLESNPAESTDSALVHQHKHTADWLPWVASFRQQGWGTLSAVEKGTAEVQRLDDS